MVHNLNTAERDGSKHETRWQGSKTECKLWGCIEPMSEGKESLWPNYLSIGTLYHYGSWSGKVEEETPQTSNNPVPCVIDCLYGSHKFRRIFLFAVSVCADLPGLFLCAAWFGGGLAKLLNAAIDIPTALAFNVIWTGLRLWKWEKARGYCCC